METKHTLGPWEVMPGDNYEIRSPLLPREYPHYCKEDSTGDFVAYIGNHAPDFGEANANLISSAPELFDACVALVEWCDKNPPAGEALYLVQQARDAVTKAMGHNV